MADTVKAYYIIIINLANHIKSLFECFCFILSITPVLKGNLKKSRKQKSGILHIVGDHSRFPKKPLSKSEN